jgi:sugar lactone lactonase YvrE
MGIGRVTRRWGALLVGLALAACSRGNESGDSGARDGGTVTTNDTGAGDAGPRPCPGGARPDVSGLTGTGDVIIGRDGTIYFTVTHQPGMGNYATVGRVTPDGTRHDNWLTIPDPDVYELWGLALDASNTHLYVSSFLTPIYVVDLTAATPSATHLDVGGRVVKDITIGPDGALYFTETGGSPGFVYRVTTDGTATVSQVTPSMVDARSLAFLADGSLLLASGALVVRLTLTNGVETGRSTFTSELAEPDGIAIDALGRVYVGDSSTNQVFRFDSDGTNRTLITSVMRPSNLEFGAGVLCHDDLYITTSNGVVLDGTLVRYAGDTAGAPVLWH